MATVHGRVNFVIVVDLLLKKGFNYCPKCGQEVISDDKSSVKHGSRLNGNRTVENVVSSNADTTATARSAPTTRVHAPSNKKSAKPYPPLECFSAFKKSKEKERSSFFVRKKGSKRSKSETMEVKITVAVMENNKFKRGNSLPLKVPAASTADEILNAVVQKHTAYNKHFNSRHEYVLVFKDGTKVETIPGTTPPETFTLCRYKEISGFGYSQIRLYLVPLFNKRLNDLCSAIEESETESFSSDESLTPSVTNLLEKYDQLQKSVPPTSSVSSTLQSISFQNPSIPSTSSSYNDLQTTASSSVIKVECPLCFQSFPINQVEAHAGECVGSFGLVDDNSVEVCPGNDISDTELSKNEFRSADYTLLNCISDLKEKGLKLQMETIRVTVWEDFKRARYRYYQPDRLLKVTFAGEPAVDDGGPKREFFAGTLDTLLFAQSF